jgi:hypothetical protein
MRSSSMLPYYRYRTLLASTTPAKDGLTTDIKHVVTDYMSMHFLCSFWTSSYPT